MLGEQLGQESGQITGMRVLPMDGGAPKIEVSIQTSGRLLDADVTNMGTYVSVVRPDGTLFGEGQGVLMTGEGETVTWTGAGVGRFLGRGTAVGWRGALWARRGGLRTCWERVYEALADFQGRRPGPGAKRRVMRPIMDHLTMASACSGRRS
jgi:hypothetical protein